MQLAQFPLAVPYLLNPVGIVGLMTISAEAKSLSVFAVELGILVFVLLLDVVVFRWANRVSDKLDEGRMLVTEKVFGFLIAAIAVQLVLDGLALEGIIAPVPHLTRMNGTRTPARVIRYGPHALTLTARGHVHITRER
jgi:tellurite resistance protein TehA-like permease